jgi:sec-independent protein translocase protein TatB
MLSIPHMIVVFVIVLVVFGPQKLPELARGLGKLMAEFRKASTDFKMAFEEEMRDIERQARELERKKQALLASHAAAAEQPAALATPSGAETQSPPAPLAASEGDTRATEAITVNPVSESVPRSNGSEEAASTGESHPSPAPEAGAEPAANPTLESAHDRQQPA